MDANFLESLKKQLASAYNDGGRDNVAIIRMKNGNEFEIATNGKTFSPDIVIDGDNVKFVPTDRLVGQTEDATTYYNTYERNRYVVALSDIQDARIKTILSVESPKKKLNPPSENSQPSEE